MDIRRALLLRKFLIRLKVAMVFFWSRNTTICTQSCQANWLSFAIPSSLNCLWSSISLASAPSSVRKYAQLLVGGISMPNSSGYKIAPCRGITSGRGAANSNRPWKVSTCAVRLNCSGRLRPALPHPQVETDLNERQEYE